MTWKDSSTQSTSVVIMLMQQVREKLNYLGDGIIDASTLLNHQVDVDVLSKAALAFARRFQDHNVDKILTIEVSGIVPALLTARELGVPMVYARKGKRVTQKDVFEAPVKSRTTDVDTIITVDKRMLSAGERILVVDDFLARGAAVRGLAQILEKADAELLGVCAVFEKTFENARKNLKELSIPILSFIDLHMRGDELDIQPGDVQRRRRLRHLHLHCKELARSCEFYRSVLGMTVLRDEDSQVVLSDGRGFELSLREDPNLESPPQWLHFGYPIDSRFELERVHTELAHCQFSKPLSTEEDGHCSFQIKDPDGYGIEFFVEGT